MTSAYLIRYTYIFFGVVYAHIFHLFINWEFCYFVEFWEFKHIFSEYKIGLFLLDMQVESSFSKSVTCFLLAPSLESSQL